MNDGDIEAILMAHSSEEGYGNSWWYWEDDADEAETVPGLGRVTTVASHTGGEGDWGTDTYIVLRIEFEDPLMDTGYYRKTGYYRSFDGTTWDGAFSRVKKAQKTIDVWEYA